MRAYPRANGLHLNPLPQRRGGSDTLGEGPKVQVPWVFVRGPSIFRAKFQNLLLFSTAGMKTSPQKHMRVLIADDQKSVGTSLAEMVGLCHHQVVDVVSTG